MLNALPALDFLGEPFMEDHEDTLHDNADHDLTEMETNSTNYALIHAAQYALCVWPG